MENLKQFEYNVAKSFSKVKEDFLNTKKEIDMTKKELSELKEALLQQNKTIKQIYENQKHLLIRVRDLEKEISHLKNNKKEIKLFA
ncbi:MAG: hypothetical protein QXE31_05385 [Candidatus Woesearchaeota archaeon]